MSPGPALTGSLWGVCGLVQAQLGNGQNQLAVFTIGSIFARVWMKAMILDDLTSVRNSVILSKHIC